MDYFTEQYQLIAMVTKLRIPYEHYVVIEPPPLFEDQYEEGDFLGLDEPATQLKNVI